MATYPQYPMRPCMLTMTPGCEQCTCNLAANDSVWGGGREQLVVDKLARRSTLMHTQIESQPKHRTPHLV